MSLYKHILNTLYSQYITTCTIITNISRYKVQRNIQKLWPCWLSKHICIMHTYSNSYIHNTYIRICCNYYITTFILYKWIHLVSQIFGNLFKNIVGIILIWRNCNTRDSLEINFVHNMVVPKAMNSYSHETNQNNWLNKLYSFYMTLAVDKMSRK